VTSRPLIPRLRRLGEELDEIGVLDAPTGDLHGAVAVDEVFLAEVDRAMRPAVHERRVPSTGTILRPRSEPATWAGGTGLEIAHAPMGVDSTDDARRYADGLSSWLQRRPGDPDELLMFDRPAGSERDLVVMARVLDGTIVQRHPSGVVRVVGGHGVLRWDGLGWHHEPPIASWIGAIATPGYGGDVELLTALLEFAVHDLGALGVGALLIYRPVEVDGPPMDERLDVPPPLGVGAPFHLAPLRHALSQVDGAAVFDRSGVLRQLGARVVPSVTAEREVDALGGTRHTSGRRYSYDDPESTVSAVREDGPVTVLRDGEVLGRSAPL
jgi:hypothetical protein